MIPDNDALRKDERVFVVVISGPIASGKSALSRAVATQLEEEHGAPAAVVDLDLVYEMLDVRSRPKDDERLWAQARRVAGRLANAILAEGRSVVVEGGDLATGAALAEFETELAKGSDVWLVLLGVDLEIARQRTQSDESRGISRDRAFLKEHYARFTTEWPGRDVLRLDTGSARLADSANAVVDWLTQAQ
jgi:adenylylsulfate kinase-like enzyme